MLLAAEAQIQLIAYLLFVTVGCLISFPELFISTAATR